MKSIVRDDFAFTAIGMSRDNVGCSILDASNERSAVGLTVELRNHHSFLRLTVAAVKSIECEYGPKKVLVRLPESAFRRLFARRKVGFEIGEHAVLEAKAMRGGGGVISFESLMFDVTCIFSSPFYALVFNHLAAGDYLTVQDALRWRFRVLAEPEAFSNRERLAVEAELADAGI